MKRMILKHKKITISVLCVLLLLCLGAGIVYYRSTPGYLLAREGSLELLPDEGTDISSDSGKTGETNSDKDSSSGDAAQSASPDEDASTSESGSSISDSGTSSSGSKENVSENNPSEQEKEPSADSDDPGSITPDTPEIPDPETSDPDKKPDIVYPHRPYELPFVAVTTN